MKEFTIKPNAFLKKEVQGYYNCDYTGYQQKNNPDFINRLKNTTRSYSELDLVQDFIEVADRAQKDLQDIIKSNNFTTPLICVLPRSKAEKSYSQSQRMFKKAIECVIKHLNADNGLEFIKRVKDTKTTHNWRLEHNTGRMPYVGIAKDTCEFVKNKFNNKTVILIDDVYTENVNIAEDFIQTIFDFGAKNVILYILAKTRS